MPIFFSERAASRCSKACLYKVQRKCSKNWRRGTNIKSYFTPKIESTLKPSNTMRSRNYALYRTKVQMPTPFLRQTLKFCIRVYCAPAEPSTNGVHQTRVQNFRVYLSKTAWVLDSEGSQGNKLEPACSRARQFVAEAQHQPHGPYIILLLPMSLCSRVS